MPVDDTPRRSLGRALLLGAALLACACGDDTTSATGTATDTDTGATGGTDQSTTALSTITIDPSVGTMSGGSGDSTSGGVDDSTTSDTGSDTGSDTSGGMDLPGQSQGQLVGVGQRMSSGNYTMVFTLGQPTQTQATHLSTNYRLQGGLVGANGNPP